MHVNIVAKRKTSQVQATVDTTSPLTHFDHDGKAHMVDVGAKSETRRSATATGTIRMQAETLALIESGTAKKGDVLGVARKIGRAHV